MAALVCERPHFAHHAGGVVIGQAGVQAQREHLGAGCSVCGSDSAAA